MLHVHCLFRVGPLHSDQQYAVRAEKPGYVMTAVDGKIGDFNAFKLGEILVKVNSHSRKVPLRQYPIAVVL